jgi:hypothetical protein
MRYVYILVYADRSIPQATPILSAVFSSEKRASSEADAMNRISREKQYTTHYYVKKEVVR